MANLLSHTFRSLCFLGIIVLIAPPSTGASDAPPLVGAVRDGNVEAVRFLLEQRADANAAEGDGLSALHWAARRGEPESRSVLALRGGGRGEDANVRRLLSKRLGYRPNWFVAALVRCAAFPSVDHALLVLSLIHI